MHGGFPVRKNRGPHGSLRRCRARGRACCAPGLGLRSSGPAWRRANQDARHRVPLRPGRWGGAWCLCKEGLCIPCPAQCSPCSATFSSRTCQELGFLHPSDALQRLLLCCSCCLMSLELEKRTLGLFFFSFVRLCTRFYIFFLSTCRLAGYFSAWMPPRHASQSAALTEAEGEAGPTQHLHSTPLCSCDP